MDISVSAIAILDDEELHNDVVAAIVREVIRTGKLGSGAAALNEAINTRAQAIATEFFSRPITPTDMWGQPAGAPRSLESIFSSTITGYMSVSFSPSPKRPRRR